MFYKNKTASAAGAAALCLSGMLFTRPCITKQTEPSLKEGIKMNQPTDLKSSGSFSAKDKFGTPVTLDWFKTTVISADFSTAMASTWSFARDAYTPVEMQFLKAFPEVVGKDTYFKPFEPLFEKGIERVDWKAAEETMESILKGHFVFDIAQLPLITKEHLIKMYSNDACFFVSVKDQATSTMLGFITFLMRGNYTAGDIKVMCFAVENSHQKRGLGKLLMSSIFKIIPDIKRIFLCTRVTNDTALKAYSAWGFTKDENPVMDHPFNLEHWPFMEYKTEQVDVLQKLAATIGK